MDRSSTRSLWPVAVRRRPRRLRRSERQSRASREARSRALGPGRPPLRQVSHRRRACLLCRCLYTHRVAPGETPTVLVLAASTAQAQTVFQYALGFLGSSEILKREVASTTAHEIRLHNGVTIAVHANSYRTVRGKTLLCAIFDEAAFWRDSESALPDVETYRAILPSLVTTNGMLIGISRPYRKTGLLFQKHKRPLRPERPGRAGRSGRISPVQFDA